VSRRNPTVLRARLRSRVWRAALIGGALLVAVPEAALGPDGATAEAQQLGEGMKRTGMVGISSEDERKLFYSLICTCGCPRETLGTCTCDFAHARREELRALIDQGKKLEEIQELYAKRYGTQALAVPPNTGGSRALWALPLVGILAGAGGVLVALRRWKRRGNAPPPPGAPGAAGKDAAGQDAVGRDAAGNAPAAPDAYDDRIDRELEELDRR